MKILTLENDGLVPNEVKRVQRYLKATEIKEITGLKHADPKEVFLALLWCDVIVIQTTLLYKYQVDDMVELMSKIAEPKQIVFTWKDTVTELFEYLKDDEEIIKIAHHKIGYYPSVYDVEDGINCVQNSTAFAENAIVVAERLRVEEEIKQLRLAKEKQYRDEAPQRHTGQKVLFKRITTGGKAFSTLVAGTVMPVLDMSEQDERSNRGVWVWGNGEPVKLLSEAPYHEYELLVEADDRRAIALEVLNMAGLFEPTESDVFSVMGLMDNALREDDKSAQIHWGITTWLDERELPRRGLRNPIETFICKALAL